MTITVKGSVTITDNGYFRCPDFSSLSLIFSARGFKGADTDLLTVAVGKNGVYAADLDFDASTGNGLVVKLYHKIGETNTLVATSDMYCGREDETINFIFDDSKAGDTIYDRAVARINNYTDGEGTPLANLLDTMSTEDLQALGAVSGVTDSLMNRLRYTLKLYNDFLYLSDNVSTEVDPLYTGASEICAAFLDNTLVAKKLLFAISKSNPVAAVSESGSGEAGRGTSARDLTDLAHVFTLSAAQFQDKLTGSADRNEIEDTYATGDYAGTLVDCRNIVLFNANDSSTYHDAKLIHISTNNYSEKSDLLNQALDNGGLLALQKTDDPSKDSAQLKRVNPVITLDQNLLNFAPFTKIAFGIPAMQNYFTMTTQGPVAWSAKMGGLSSFPDGLDATKYAEAIHAKLADALPTAGAVYNLSVSGMDAKYTGLGTKLAANPDFNIRERSVLDYFTVKDSSPGTKELTSADALNLQALQRSVKLTGDVTDMKATKILLESNLASAIKVADMSKGAFVALVKDRDPGITQLKAEATHDQARGVVQGILATAVHYLRYEKDGAYVPQALNDVHISTSDPISNLPNMSTLFGNFNSCDCCECQSVYSAPAYLTDLLNWLKHLPSVNGLARLTTMGTQDRRADIPYLLLNCKNTNTLMPYIDIVNEILSVNMLIKTGASTPVIQDAYSHLQTTKSYDEIKAEPEHRFTASEDLLKNYPFPWVLPYNAAFDETQSYLAAFDKPYHSLIHDFSKPADQYTTAVWAKAFLGLSNEQAAVITTDHSGSTYTATYWSNYWGLNNAITSPYVGQVLTVAGVTVSELKELLLATYINNGTAITLVAPTAPIAPATTVDPCDIDHFTFSSFPLATSDRFMRFLRLKRKTGLSTQELDLAIKNLGTNTNKVDDAFLIKLASCMAFANKYAISFLDTQVFINANVYTTVASSSIYSDYYKSRFQSELLAQATITFFSAAPTGNYTTNAINALSLAEKQMLSSALNVPVTVIEAIITQIGGSAAFNVTTLAQINRYALFIKLFVTDVAELPKMITFLGNPFSNSDVMKGLWNFEDALSTYNVLNTAPRAFDDVVMANGDYSLTSQDAAAKALWVKAEDAFQKARIANPKRTFSSTTGMPSATDDVTFYTDVVIGILDNEFHLGTANIRTLLNNYPTSSTSPTWLNSFIANPDLTSRQWVNNPTSSADIKPVFGPAYRLLKRIATVAALEGLDQDGLSYIITNFISTTGPFYWLTYTFTATSVPVFTLIKNATLQAAKTGIKQSLYLAQSVAYSAATTASSATILSFTDSAILALYNLMPAASAYKQLSVFEFTEMFRRAQSIAQTPTDLVSVMQVFNRLFTISENNAIKITDAWSWVWTWTSSAPTTFSAAAVTSVIAGDVKRVLHTLHPAQDDWNDVVLPVRNNLRASLRDALVGLHLAINDRQFKNEKDIYNYYLLDTQIAPCMETSRMVAAISSTQLIMHRALLNLENTVSSPFILQDSDKSEWEWRKNYRVWEANRKVFLYPENWIDPSLRKQQTTLFKEAADLLQQDEINDINSETAYSNYLTSLGEVANLDVRATYIDTPPLPPNYTSPLSSATSYVYSEKETLHVFARTWNPPYAYYHRSMTGGNWTAWESMDVEIDSDHLVPVMFNGKMHLFFPMFIDKQHRTVKHKVGTEDVAAPYIEVKMCYTKFSYGKWTKKKILNATLLAGNVSGPDIPNTEAGLVERLRSYDGNVDRSVPGQDPVYVWSRAGSGTTRISNYSFLSMDRNAFFFWPQVVNGEVFINCRRSIDPQFIVISQREGYSFYSYEWGFKMGSIGDKCEVIKPVFPAAESPRFLARPYATVPYAQQLKYGRDTVNFDPNAANNGETGMWVKSSVVETFTSSSSTRILYRMNGPFVMTYPTQYQHSLQVQPFFFSDRKRSLYISNVTTTTGTKFRVQLNEHPYVVKMLEALNRFGVEGLLNSNDLNGLKRQAQSENFFNTQYSSTTSIDNMNQPVLSYDFSRTGTYSIYNWEVFFHTVTLIARQLRQSNKFAEAIRWLSFVFDPTDRDLSLLELRYWQIKPFKTNVSQQSIRNMIRLLSTTPTLAADIALKADFVAQINAWRADPFDPHMIASMRPRAYMMWTVMEYVNTLTDWGDYLFRQDTTESVNEAINLYIVASEILGPRPKKIDRPIPVADRCFNDIQSSLSDFSDVLVNFENSMPGLVMYAGTNTASVMPANTNTATALHGVVSPGVSAIPDLLFCVPDNPNLVAMWDKVEDRLFKIRHCMNIDGKVRQLALFSPPIDPALLVQAAANGISITDALAELAAPLPNYRFNYLVQKANEFCNDVKGLGSQLLTIFEKKDAEELSLFRQVHEKNILLAARALKQMAIDEAKQNYETLVSSKNLIQIRLDDYSNRQYKNNREDNAIRQSHLSEDFMYAEQGVRLISGLLNLIPDLYLGFTVAKLSGGQKFSILSNAGAEALGVVSGVNRNKASMSLTYAGYDRRQEEWTLQVKTATEELAQVDRQLLSAQIRIAVAEKDLENHDLQVEQSQEMYDWLKDKYTNGQLYIWMMGQIKSVYYKSFDLAYKMAKRAQVSYDYELGTSATNIVQFGHWDSSRAGLLAGEKLSVQLRQLESAFIDNNVRELEMSKNISLALLNPMALQTLISTGSCEIEIPELLFDLDQPGQYFRRIKSVSISIPCVVGPQININARLDLNQHAIRKDKTAYTTSMSLEGAGSESIATSSSQNDSGVFELNFRDERFLPFEGKGAVSKWTLTLTDLVRQFDFKTISDVVMHMKYTARFDGGLGDALKTSIPAHLSTIAGAINGGKGFYYAFSVRHDLPNEWQTLTQNGSVLITISKSRLPYFMQACNPVLATDAQAITIYTDSTAFTPTIETRAGTTTTVGGYHKTTFANPLTSPTYALALDVRFALNYGGGPQALNDVVIVAKIGVS